MSGDSEVPFWREEKPRPANMNDMPQTLFYLVTPGYLPAMRIPFARAGFSRTVTTSAPPRWR